MTATEIQRPAGHPHDEHLRGVLRAWLEREKSPTVAADLLDALNARIPDKDFKVGPSYLMRPEAATPEGRERIWRTSILPLLEELHYGDTGIDVSKRYGLATLQAELSATEASPPLQVPTPEAQPADERADSAHDPSPS